RLRFLDHADSPVPPGRVENPALAHPERDVVDRIAVRDEVADRRLLDLARRRLLLVGVPRHEPPDPPVRHVHEAGAVDPSRRHPAPEVPRAKVGARDLEWRSGRIGDELAVTLLERLLANPAGVVVRGRDAHPPVQPPLDAKRLPAESLRHLLGVVSRLGTEGRDVDGAPHARFATFASSICLTAGQSSSITAYHAESRIESGRIMCFRKIPSKRAPTPSSAPRTRRFRASVLNSTRIAPQSSKARRRSRYFVSTFAPVPHCARSSHVQPIATRRCIGSTFRYRVEPTGRSATCTTNGTSRSPASARSNQRSKPSEYMFV